MSDQLKLARDIAARTNRNESIRFDLGFQTWRWIGTRGRDA